MMFKKLIGVAVVMSIAMSFAVMPAHADSFYNTGTFSSANWAQYERGFYTDTSNFTENMQEYANTSYDDDQLISVRMVASTSSKIDKTKNPVAYKYGQYASDYGAHETDKAAYAHMRLYLATFDDANHNIFDDFYLRMDKDGTGSSRETFMFDNWKNDSEIYAVDYTSSAAYVTKDWTGILKKQGYNGNGPNASTSASNCDSKTRTLSASDYDKIDIIVEYNKQNGATTYIFANGKFMANYYDSGLTDKHFHGIVFRTPANKTPRNNSSYIAVKMDTDRIGHREYYNTDDYYVTFEDVMQDAGLGDAIDSTMIFKTSEIQNYMPGNNQVAYTYYKDASGRVRINEGVTYSGNTATISATNTDTENYSVAARMIAGMYPLNGKTGISYESYHPRAKLVKLSFDQTISNSGIWLEYATANNYGSGTRALQMWNNSGRLVVGIQGGNTVDCNGNNGKPSASMTGTNLIDWILELDETNECVNDYIFINGTLAGKGSFGNQYTPRINDIVLNTKNASGTITISNWSMTVYNGTASLTGMMGLFFDEPLDNEYNAGGETISLPNNKILDLGEGLNLKNGYVNTGNGYIKSGNKKIKGSNVHFGSNGKIKMGDGDVVKITETNLDGSTVQGFMIGKTAPAALETVVLSISGSANGKDYTGSTISCDFDFSKIRIEGLANYSFTVNDIPEGLTLEVKND